MTIPFNTIISCPTLVGRGPLFHELVLILAQAQQGQGQTVMLAGEAGVGKSRLVAELKSAAVQQGFSVLQGSCFEPDRVLPYAPLIDMIQHFCETRPEAAVALAPFAAELYTIFPELAASLPATPPTPALEPELEKRRLGQAFTRFLLSQPGPSLIVIEDIHWSDASSLELLLTFARRVATKPVMLLVTYRHDEIQGYAALQHTLAELDRGRLAVEFVLDRLTPAEVELLIRGIFAQAQPIRTEFTDSVYALTDGNPFFVEEMLKALITAGDVYYTGQEWKRKPLAGLRIPRSVQDAVQRRAQQLSPAAHALLTLAAVVGQRFAFSLLRQLTQQAEAELLPLIKELISAQLLVEVSAEQFAFRHALTRQAVATGLLARERQTTHQAIGAALEQLYSAPAQREAHLVELAYHYYEASNWAKALEYARRSGEKAQALYAPRAAVEQFTRAIEAAHQLQEGRPDLQAALLSLYRARGQAHETMGEFDQALADHTKALGLARSAADRYAEWQSLIDLGFTRASHNYRTTGDYFQQALALAQQIGDPVLIGQSLNWLGNWLAIGGQPRSGQRHHQEALVIFEALGEPRGLAQTLDMLGTAHNLAGDLIKGTAYLQRAITLFRAHDDRAGLASSLANLAMRASLETLAAAGTLGEASHDAELAVQASRAIGWRANEALALAHLALCQSQLGDLAAALETGQLALAIADEIGHHFWMSYTRYVLGRVYSVLLDNGAARTMLEAALQIAQDFDFPLCVGLASAALASIAIRQQELAHAAASLTSASTLGQPPETLGQQWVELARAELALARGDAALALQIVDGLIEFIPQLASGQTASQIARLRGAALAAQGRFVEAEAALWSAEREAQSRGAQATLWQIHQELGQLYRQQSRRSEAERAFAAARAIVDLLADTLPEPPMRAAFLRQAYERLPALPTPTPRQAAKHEWGGLTDREREVAVLIAKGHANRAIAAQLMVGAKTVEAHISRILSKLGYSSRAQIAAWSVERGLTQAPPDLRSEH